MKKHGFIAIICFLVTLLLAFGCSNPSNENEEAELDSLGPSLESNDEEELVTSDSDLDMDSEEEEQEIPIVEPPMAEFLSARFISGTEIEFEFSSSVTVLSLSFDPFVEVDSVEGGSTVKVSLEEETAPAMQLTVEIIAEDEWENAITVEVPLISKNNHVPKLQINELRTEHSNPKAEFIEFRIVSDGNLGALRVFAASNSKNPMVYQFAPVEVIAGEYVVLHMRTFDESCVDEFGDLDESGGTDSCPTARDFWISGSTELLRKTDAVYVLDQDDRVLDAVMFSEKPDPAWGKDSLAAAAEFLFAKGAWTSPSGKICSPEDAVDSSKTSPTRSISRDETVDNTGTKADWYITANSNATPGLPNSTVRY